MVFNKQQWIDLINYYNILLNKNYNLMIISNRIYKISKILSMMAVN